jgi:hypothetical protein
MECNDAGTLEREGIFPGNGVALLLGVQLAKTSV